MFWKKKKESDKKAKYVVESEDLAVPEVHKNEVHEDKAEIKEEDASIAYDNVAIPEIHVRKKK